MENMYVEKSIMKVNVTVKKK